MAPTCWGSCNITEAGCQWPVLHPSGALPDPSRSAYLPPVCGITGYAGKRSAQDVLMDGLRRLEYRGYDSAGGTLVEPDGLVTVKSSGKLVNLEKALAEAPNGRATVGIGHTRWATHGAPTDTNAHPHLGHGGRIAVVHNGIIENHNELRFELQATGRVFVSDTDTEIA